MKTTVSTIALVAAAFTAPALAETRGLGAHEHGHGSLNMAIEGNAVLMELEAPGADIVGFEYEAKSAEDRAAIDAAIAALAKPLELFVPSEGAGCVVTAANVALITEEDEHDDHDHDEHAHDEEKHDEHDHDEHKEAGHDDHDHEDHDHEDHAEEKHDEHDHDEHAHDDHDEEGEKMGIDAHAWLDPVNAQLWLKVIADELSEANPAGAETYQANAAAASEKLSNLIEEIHDGMGLPHDIPAILSHDFLAYFENRFDIHEIETLKSHDDEALGLASMTEAKEDAEEAGVNCFLYTVGEAPESFASFAEGMDLKFVEIDQLGANQPIGAELYGETIRGIATSLMSCVN